MTDPGTRTQEITLDVVDGRHRLRLQRRLAHPVERVWRAITEPAELSRWFPAQVTFEPRVGAQVRFRMDGEPDTEGTVDEIDPPRLLQLTWDTNVLRFELTPDDAGCVLLFSHVFDDHAGAASFASGWDACLDGLVDVASGNEPAPPGPMDVAHEQRVRDLGLRVGDVAPGDGGWAARVERQLVRPADVARPLLPADGDGTRWQLGEGTGHGARLVVTRDGLPDEAAATAALADLHEQVERIAAEAMEARP